MSDPAAEQKDLRAYLRPVLKRWWLIALVVPVVTVGTYLYYDHKPKTYEASSELYLQPSTVEQLVFGGKAEAQTKVENLALLLQTSGVAERVARQHPHLPAGSVAAQAIEKSSFIAITTAAGSAGGAARLADAYASTFVQMQRRQVQREARRAARAAEANLKELGSGEATVHRREALEQQIENLHLVAREPAGGIKQVEQAAAFGPVEHDPTGNAIFAFVIALMLAVGGAYGLEYLNRRIGRIEDAEEVYGLPVLAEVPQIGAPAPLDRDGVALAEAFRGPFQRLQTKLDVLGRERPLRTILIASAAPGEGKSIVARNLALAYREAGRNVAVLDADFRKASLGGLLAAREGLGLADILAGRASFGQVVQEVPVHAGPNGNGAGPAATALAGGELAMVPAGEGAAQLSPALASTEMRDTLRTAADAYGTAIIDAPPLLAAADGLPLLAEVDAVVVVTRLGHSTRESARRLLAELERVPGVHVAGLVVNGIPARVYRARSYGYYRR